jgi:hypothetical protein
MSFSTAQANPKDLSDVRKNPVNKKTLRGSYEGYVKKEII